MAGFRVPKRRADWLAGRMTAKPLVAAALAEILPGPWPLAAIEIANESTGMPYARVPPEGLAPPPLQRRLRTGRGGRGEGFGAVAGFGPGVRLPVSVSISHAAGRALCAAVPILPLPRHEVGEGLGVPCLGLGIDLEAVEPRSQAFLETFFTLDEQRFVGGAPRAERALRANLVWCAKEAVLKALGLGLTADTLGLCCLPQDGPADPVEWPLEPAGGGWRPYVATCRDPLVPGGGTIRGIWRAFPGFAAALARIDGYRFPLNSATASKRATTFSGGISGRML